jgi:hypothetical protein
MRERHFGFPTLERLGKGQPKSGFDVELGSAAAASAALLPARLGL